MIQFVSLQFERVVGLSFLHYFATIVMYFEIFLIIYVSSMLCWGIGLGGDVRFGGSLRI